MAFTSLVSERLTLRALTLDDAAALAKRRSDPDTAAYQAWEVPYPLERAAALIDDVAKLDGPTRGEWFQAAIEVTATRSAIGDVAVHLSEDGKTAQIGYTLDPAARGQGFATEAASALITYLLEVTGVHRIEAETDPRNEASGRVLERLGLANEGTKREAFWLGETVTDSAFWGLLARDWRR